MLCLPTSHHTVHTYNYERPIKTRRALACTCNVDLLCGSTKQHEHGPHEHGHEQELSKGINGKHKQIDWENRRSRKQTTKTKTETEQIDADTEAGGGK